MSYMAPKQFLAANKIKVEVGQVLSPIEMGMEPHPVFGHLPVVTVLEAKEDGSIFLLGEIECECGATRVIHPGDWFQVRACETCTKRRQRRARRPTKSEEEKAQAQAERELKQAEANIIRAEARAAAAAEKASLLQAKLEERRSLIAKVAAEKGVGISHQ